MNVPLRCALVIASLSVLGCSFEFTDLTDLPRDTPATFSIGFSSNDESDELQLNASLDPGRDADGSIRSVTSDLAVFGQSIVPTVTGSRRTRYYGAKWSLSAQLQGATSLTLLAPAVAGIVGGPHAVEVSVPRRIGAQTLTFRNGEAIVLPLRASAFPDGSVQWRLDVVDSLGARQVSVTSVGRPPEQITIPRAWLPAPLPARYKARFDIIQGFSSDFVQDKYTFSISFQAILNWTVVLEP
jgi:hypothetical protein